MFDSTGPVHTHKERMSLRQKVYQDIKREIVTCKLPPGSSLSEFELAERFEVSKTPIREALAALHTDGLVHYTPNRGFTVAPVSIRDVQEIFEAREFFETTLFCLALGKITEANVAALESFSKVPVEVDSPPGLDVTMQANENFHLEIARIAGNSRLFEYYRNLLMQAQRLIYLDFKNNNIYRTWHTSHHEIIEAIRNRDEAAGLQSIRETLAKARRRILGTE